MGVAGAGGQSGLEEGKGETEVFFGALVFCFSLEEDREMGDLCVCVGGRGEKETGRLLRVRFRFRFLRPLGAEERDDASRVCWPACYCPAGTEPRAAPRSVLVVARVGMANCSRGCRGCRGCRGRDCCRIPVGWTRQTAPLQYWFHPDSRGVPLLSRDRDEQGSSQKRARKLRMPDLRRVATVAADGAGAAGESARCPPCGPGW